MQTDYKISQSTQHDDGSWTILYRAYEGDITTEDEFNEAGNLVPVTRYRRTQLLREVTLQFPSMPKDELIHRLNSRLAMSRTRTSIPEQRNA